MCVSEILLSSWGIPFGLCNKRKSPIIPQFPSDQSENQQQHLRRGTQHHPITWHLLIHMNQSDLTKYFLQYVQTNKLSLSCVMLSYMHGETYQEEYEVKKQNYGHSTKIHTLQYSALCGTETAAAAVVLIWSIIGHQHWEATPQCGDHLKKNTQLAGSKSTIRTDKLFLNIDQTLIIQRHY